MLAVCMGKSKPDPFSKIKRLAMKVGALACEALVEAIVAALCALTSEDIVG
jgi:hypothetical protein